MVGETLSHFRVTAKLGEGGMGEVYRAQDTKLGRDVAIKVLPDELEVDEERVARFEREARLLASLSHPNIAAIYGFEDNALVLELVEGPTLAERIEQVGLADAQMPCCLPVALVCCIGFLRVLCPRHVRNSDLHHAHAATYRWATG